MSRIEILKRVLFIGRKELHGKELILHYLLGVPLIFAASLIGYYSRDYLPYRGFQIFILCFILITVWVLARTKPPVR